MRNLKIFIKFAVMSLLLLFVVSSCQMSSQILSSSVDKNFKKQYFDTIERDDLRKYFISISDEKSAKKHMATFDNSMALVYYEYVRAPDMNKLMQSALKAAKKQKNIDNALDESLKAAITELDPHSRWLNSEELKELNDTVQGEYVGIGTVISEHPQGVLLQRVYENGPAYKIGLKKDDIITSADGKSLKGMDISEVAEALRGKINTLVHVRILRDGIEKEYTIRRSKVEINPVWAELKQDNIIYLRLDTFNVNASLDIERYFRQYSQKGGNKLILDLRSNPGGLLPEAIDVSDLFLPKKASIVSASKRDGKIDERWFSRKADISKNIPMVVLVDEYAASASEIVAAALKDNDRAILIGHRTFGKGTIQEVMPISEYGALRLTFALYQSPDGRIIQASGVAPNIEIVADEKTEIIRAEDLEHSILPLNRHIPKAEYIFNEGTCNKIEENDPILDCALQLLTTNKIKDYSVNWQE